MKVKITELQSLPLGRGVKVLYCNEDGLLALEKPAGLMSHPNRASDEKRSLLNAHYNLEQEFYYWRNKAGEEQRVGLVHRLDSATSGVILLSLNEELTPILKDAFAKHTVAKIYYALVKGATKGTGGVWDDRLMKDRINGKRIVKNATSVRAKARFQLVKKSQAGFPLSLLKLMPVTGRRHQLRIQCRKHGAPILGDRTYGSFSFNNDVKHETGMKRMMLHSGEVKFEYYYNRNKRQVHVESEIPPEFEALLSYRPGMDMGVHMAKLSNPGQGVRRSSLLQ